MKTKAIFKRYEYKCLITKTKKETLLQLFEQYMKPDEFGRSSIFNIYYDTPDFLLIRRSSDKPVYKEKLRLRSYDRANKDTKVFLELKKKYRYMVYKRRISLNEKSATDYFAGGYTLPESQIGKEIDYVKSFYKDITPQVFIAYDREAFFGKEDENLRITFDENILWRDWDLSLCSEKYGNPILQNDMLLMEIKVTSGLPLWLTDFLTKNNIYKNSFSKYGYAYKELLKRKEVKINAA